MSLHSPTNRDRRNKETKVDEIEMTSTKTRRKSSVTLLDTREKCKRYVNIKFALPQGVDDFGFIRPPKWGKILSYHDGLWTIEYVHHVPPLIHNGKGNEVVTLNDSEFDYLIAKTRMRQIVYTNIRNQKFQGDISIDTKVVPKHRRQYIDLKFTIPCGKRFGEDNVKADDREYTFCMISDYRACDVGKGKTKDVWVITYDDNTQHFTFQEDLLSLMSNKVDYEWRTLRVMVTRRTKKML